MAEICHRLVPKHFELSETDKPCCLVRRVTVKQEIVLVLLLPITQIYFLAQKPAYLFANRKSHNQPDVINLSASQYLCYGVSGVVNTVEKWYVPCFILDGCSFESTGSYCLVTLPTHNCLRKATGSHLIHYPQET